MRADTTIAPCSPWRNWLHVHAAWCCAKLSRSFCDQRSQKSAPRNGFISSGMPIGLCGSTGSDQSMRLVESHCLSLPFWYRLSSRSRPSSYSHVNELGLFTGTVHRSLTSTGTAYFGALLIVVPLGGAFGPGQPVDRPRLLLGRRVEGRGRRR